MRLILLTLSFPLFCQAATIETVAGTGKAGYSGDGKIAAKAELNQPFGVTVGPGGDLYFCDTNNHVIRRISKDKGVIETIVGTGKKGYTGDGGPANRATLDEPYEIRFHPNGDMFWVERTNHVVRRMDASGKISTVAGTGKPGFTGDDGPGSKAAMDQPHSIEFDREAKHLFICDIKNHRIRRVDLTTSIIDTWCGTGQAKDTPDGAKASPQIPLKGPRALAIDPDGNLWLALREGNTVYRIDMHTGTLHHVAGTGKAGFTGNGGPAKLATIAGPKGVAVSPDGKHIYLADTETHSVRAIDLTKSPPTLELIAGDGTRGDGPDSSNPLKCRMSRVHGVGIDPKSGDLYVGDSETHKVRVIRGL